MNRALSLSLLVVSGCASIGHGNLVSYEEKPLDSRTEQRSTDRIDARVSQEGTAVSVRTERLCEEVRIDRVLRVDRYEKINENPGSVYVPAIAGAALGGVGIAALVTPTSFEFDSLTSEGREMNPRAVRGAGGVLLTGGVALGVLALVNGLKAAGITEESRELDRRPVPTGPPARCEPAEHAADVPVTLLASSLESPLDLGTTDDSGVISLRLERHVPERALLGGRPELVLTAGEQTTIIDPEPLLAPLDDAAWSEADPVGCSAPSAPSDCRGVIEYLRNFPTGRRAEEAKKILRAADARLKELAEIAAEKRRLELERERARVEREEAERRRRYEAERARRNREAAAAKKRAEEKRRCRARCERACGGDAGCVRACVRERC